MSPRSKIVAAVLSVNVLLAIAVVLHGVKPTSPADVTDESADPITTAAPAAEPASGKRIPAMLVRALEREEGAKAIDALLEKQHVAVVSEKRGPRELSHNEIAAVLREKDAQVVDEGGAIHVRRAAGKPVVRMIAREDGETLAEALVREDRRTGGRTFSAIESRSRGVGAPDAEMERLLEKDAPYEVRPVEETTAIHTSQPRSEARGAGGSWTFEKLGETEERTQPAVARLNGMNGTTLPLPTDVTGGRIQLASGAPLAAILPPDVGQMPTPAPTPAFCPEGTREQWKKTKTSKERFCLRTDRAGVPVKQGPFVTTYPSGKTRVEGAYENGRATGTWVEYHPNGRKADEGAYKNGKRQGTWIAYWASGAMQSRGEYRDGLKSGKWTWFDDKGRKESEGTIQTSDNLEHEQGQWTYYHPNGTKRAQGKMKNGRREGRWTEWGIDGRVRSIDDYRGGDKES